MKYRLHLYIGVISMLLGISVAGQRGPGGVSDDSDDATNCRLWLDAGALNLADGSDVEEWIDISVSLEEDTAFWDSDQSFLPPDFRSDPAAGINGKPTISFEGGGMLSIGRYDGTASETTGISFDLNSNPNVETTYEQTIFIAFRTSSDVTSRQILWEEGGSARGFTIYIYNGTIRIGAYDDNEDNDPGQGGGQGHESGVRTFGFTWKELPVQPNTTYVVSLVYNVPTDNEVLTNATATATTGLNGTLNGLVFPATMEWGGQEWNQAGVGGVFTHPDPIGIGGLNRTSYNETGPLYLYDDDPDDPNRFPTGSFGFTGRISEICYYAFSVSPCQRIIIENYLAAKYFATVIANDKYDYQTSYGNGVIGIGKENNSDFHNVSQGFNLFEFRAGDDEAEFTDVFSANAPNYILTGHNNNPLSWTDDNVPDTTSIQRLRRVWRWDFTGAQISPTTPELSFRINSADLPALPTGFSEYGIMIESSNGFLPNFNETNSEIFGLTLNGSTYEADVEIEDGTYLTIVAIRPQVQFTQSTAFSIEGDDPPQTQPGQTLVAELNFQPNPINTYNATIQLEDDDAFYGTDYEASSPTINISFSSGNTQVPIPITIINDNTQVDDNPIERFFAIITGTSSNLIIGQRDSVRYRILDNDPPPTASFQSDNISFNEVDGTYSVPVEIIGTFSGSPTVEVSLMSGGTATPGVDFSIVSPQTLTFSTSNPVQNVVFEIIDDDIDAMTPFDEFDEWFRLEITDATGVGFAGSPDVETQVNIIDLDPEPTVQFQSITSEGYEAVSDPRIYVELSAPSAKLIVVPFSITGGTAQNEPAEPADYTAESSAILIIPPGAIEGYLYFDIPTSETRLFIYSDDDDTEIAETIEFTLSDIPGPTHAQLGTNVTHTFIIRDYVPFDNSGAAGVGKDQDNTFWLVADEALTGNPSSIPNLSPRPISIIQNGSSHRPSVVDNQLNGRKVLRFDASGNSNNDDYLSIGDPTTLGQSPLINTAGQYDSKSIFIVFSPDVVNSSSGYQTIFEEGGGGRGISIYLKNEKLYFQAWNNPDDDGNASPNLAPWGNGHEPGGQYAITQSTSNLIAGTIYIASFHYQNNMLNNPPTDEGLRLYLNGVKEDTYTNNTGRLYFHPGRTAIGCVDNDSFFDDGPLSGQSEVRCFDGDIAEILYFNEPNTRSSTRMNEARIQIIHNYLAAKYNITSPGSNLGANQFFNEAFTDNVSDPANFFGNEVAGIAQQASGSHHLDAKGTAELRVSTPVWSGSNGFLIWGHNGESLTNTWPFSSPGNDLPQPINERSGRIWKFFESQDGVNNVQIEIDFSASNNSDEISNDRDILRLLTHSNPDPNDFSNAMIYSPSPGQPTSSVVRFSEVSVSDGMYMALGNTSDYFGTPLPIELLRFNARLIDTHVAIDWATASELNNDYFVVERAGEDLVWEQLMTVNGAGNSNELIRYQEKDRSPLRGISYYRLKQVDFDGEFSYSDPVSIFNPEAGPSEEVFMYPNPVKGGEVFFRIPVAFRKFATTVSVHDASGKLIFAEQINPDSDIHSFSVDLFNRGIFFVHFRSNVLSETKKLVIR
jgi:hypothetical protein